MTSLRSPRLILSSLAVASLAVACAQAKLGGKANNRSDGQQLGGDAKPTCLKLGDTSGPGQTPTQAPIIGTGGFLPGPVNIGGKDGSLPNSGGYHGNDGFGGKGDVPGPGGYPGGIGGSGGTDVVVLPPVGPTGGPGSPGGNQPQSSPGASAEPTPCGPAGGPITQVDFPGQTPNGGPSGPIANQDSCGKDSYCGGGPGQTPQWPTTAVGGGAYVQADVTSCLAALQTAGLNTNGPLHIDVRTLNSVSVLSGNSYEDRGLDHALVIIKSVGVLGQSSLKLLNPNALYCLKDVSVLAQTSITSCLQNNVVVTKQVSVLSQGAVQVVDCR